MAEAATSFPRFFACEIIKYIQQWFQERLFDLYSKAKYVVVEAGVSCSSDELQLEVMELQTNGIVAISQ